MNITEEDFIRALQAARTIMESEPSIRDKALACVQGAEERSYLVVAAVQTMMVHRGELINPNAAASAYRVLIRSLLHRELENNAFSTDAFFEGAIGVMCAIDTVIRGASR